MMIRATIVVACVALVMETGVCLTCANAAQGLIPTPYPSATPGATPLNPSTPSLGGGQEIMKDPYPQNMGPTSQGNPPITRSQRGQRLVPSINQRKYRVDRPAR